MGPHADTGSWGLKLSLSPGPEETPGKVSPGRPGALGGGGTRSDPPRAVLCLTHFTEEPFPLEQICWWEAAVLQHTTPAGRVGQPGLEGAWVLARAGHLPHGDGAGDEQWVPPQPRGWLGSDFPDALPSTPRALSSRLENSQAPSPNPT